MGDLEMGFDVRIDARMNSLLIDLALRRSLSSSCHDSVVHSQWLHHACVYLLIDLVGILKN